MKLKDYQLISPKGTKAISLEQFNNESLWKSVTPFDSARNRNKQLDIDRTVAFRDAIGVIYRCIDVRSAAISSLPFSVLRGEEVVLDSEGKTEKGYEWIEKFTNLLYLTETSLLLSSEAFWLKEQSVLNTLMSLRWLAAPYIMPKYDEQEGIVGFERSVGNKTDMFSPDQIVYFWIQNPLTELTPDIPQVLSAATSAGVIINYEDFVSKFYQRGAVRATILKTDRSIPPKERNRLREFWQNFMSGANNAYTTEVVAGDVEAQVIGEGAGDSERTEVLVSRRKDIATSLGVPYSLLFGDTSSSYTAGPTEEKNFLNYTVIPRAKLIQTVLNDQLFRELGLTFRFNLGALPAFKEAGEVISKIFTTYIDALMPHSVAAKIAGIVLPEGIAYEDLDKYAEEERQRQFEEKQRIVQLNSKLVGGNEGGSGDSKKPNPKASNAAEDNNLKSVEVKRFQKWMKNRDGNILIDEFESDLLDEEEKLLLFKYFVDKRGGGDDQPPFFSTNQLSVKAMQVYGDAEGVEPDGLIDLENEQAEGIEGAFEQQLAQAFAGVEGMSDIEFWANFERLFYDYSGELKNAIFMALLAYADFGVSEAVKKVSLFYPGFDPEDSRLEARDWATKRALEVFNLVMATSLKRARANFEEYQKGGLSREWLLTELKKTASPERALVIAQNESIAVITQAAYIVYSHTKLVQYVKWVTMRDERVCPRCGPLHGKVFPMRGAPAIPVHVRCRCQVLPMVDSRILRLLAGLL